MTTNPVLSSLASRGQSGFKQSAGVRVLKAEDAFTDADHGFKRWWPICEQTVGTTAISMALGRLAPGQRGTLHVHDIDTAIYSVAGEVVAVFKTPAGGLQEVHAERGEFLYIPAGIPHGPFNPSKRDDYVYVVARPGLPD